jgi:hypothetical protein
MRDDREIADMAEVGHVSAEHRVVAAPDQRSPTKLAGQIDW